MDTLAGLRDHVYSQVDDNTDFYPPAEVDRVLNECIRVINLFTGVIQTSVDLTTVPLRYFYDVPDTIMIPLAVYLDSRQLRRSAFSSIALRRRLWSKETTGNLGPVSNWCSIGIRKIGIHPADAIGGRTLTIFGVTEPAVVSSDTDVIQLPDEMIDAVEALAGHVLQLKEGGKVFADSSTGYQEFLSQMKDWERWKKLVHPRYWVEAQKEKVA